MRKIRIRIQKEEWYEDLPLPEYHSNDAAGMDLYAAVSGTITIASGEFKMIPTGIRIAIPPGYEGQIRPRSGLACDHGIGILNSPGTIDADYRGVVGVILFNFSKKPFNIKRGDRIAQLVITKVEHGAFKVVEKLDRTERNNNGFGSTGV